MAITRRKFIKSGLVTATGVALIDGFWMERFFIEMKEFHIGSSTENSENIRVLQVSDLHLRSINYQFTQLIEKINVLRPDLIVFTGDVIDKSKNLSLLNDFLKLIDQSIKKVATLGNWEYLGKVNVESLSKVYADNNCDLLINRSMQYSFRNKTISVTGVDDFLCGDADFDTAIMSNKVSDYHLVLIHCPQYNDYILSKMNKDTKVDLVLSGHTHGGQVNIFGLVLYLPQGCGNYLKGWYNNSYYKHYVSKGVGAIFPVRFGARAEVAMFNLSV